MTVLIINSVLFMWFQLNMKATLFRNKRHGYVIILISVAIFIFSAVPARAAQLTEAHKLKLSGSPPALQDLLGLLALHLARNDYEVNALVLKLEKDGLLIPELVSFYYGYCGHEPIVFCFYIRGYMGNYISGEHFQKVFHNPNDSGQTLFSLIDKAKLKTFLKKIVLEFENIEMALKAPQNDPTIIALKAAIKVYENLKTQKNSNDKDSSRGLSKLKENSDPDEEESTSVSLHTVGTSKKNRRIRTKIKFNKHLKPPNNWPVFDDYLVAHKKEEEEETVPLTSVSYQSLTVDKAGTKNEKQTQINAIIAAINSADGRYPYSDLKSELNSIKDDAFITKRLKDKISKALMPENEQKFHKKDKEETEKERDLIQSNENKNKNKNEYLVQSLRQSLFYDYKNIEFAGVTSEARRQVDYSVNSTTIDNRLSDLLMRLQISKLPTERACGHLALSDCPDSYKQFTKDLTESIYKQLKVALDSSNSSDMPDSDPAFKGSVYELPAKFLTNKVTSDFDSMEHGDSGDINQYQTTLTRVEMPRDHYCFYHALAHGLGLTDNSEERVFQEITTSIHYIMENNPELTARLNQILGTVSGSVEEIAAMAYVDMAGFQLWGHTGMLPFIAWWFQMPVAVVTPATWTDPDGAAMLFYTNGSWELLTANNTNTIQQRIIQRRRRAPNLLILENVEGVHWDVIELTASSDGVQTTPPPPIQFRTQHRESM